MALLDTMGLRRVPGTILPGDYGLYIHGCTWADLNTLHLVPDNSYILAHVPSKYQLDRFRVIMMLRDPRNVLFSYIKHRGREGYVYGFPQALADFWGYPFVDVYRSYLGWRGRSVIMRYEDMPPHVIGNGHGIYRDHEKDWNTRTGSPSQWEEVWDEVTERTWKACGGQELLAEAGYG